MSQITRVVLTSDLFADCRATAALDEELSVGPRTRVGALVNSGHRGSSTPRPQAPPQPRLPWLPLYPGQITCLFCPSPGELTRISSTGTTQSLVQTPQPSTIRESQYPELPAPRVSTVPASTEWPSQPPCPLGLTGTLPCLILPLLAVSPCRSPSPTTSSQNS